MLSYNLLMLLLVCAGLLSLWRFRLRYHVSLAYVVVLVVLGFLGALLSAVEGFGKMKLLAWLVFLHLPLYLGGLVAVFWRREPALVHVCASLTLFIWLVAVDAFLIEPRWLAVTRVRLSTPKLEAPVRVAVITDIQTDRPGGYEERVLDRVAAEKPDLVLLGGDYLHIEEESKYRRAKATMNALLRQAGLDAPLGIYAVKGNVDWQDWPELFTGLPVVTLDTTTTLDLGPVALTGLTLGDSFNTELVVTSSDEYHIVLGHSPNFSLGQVDADLLIAGHTHGGQVQLPLIGPVFTLSAVPRTWASGVMMISPGKTLIVSRGVGMERGRAPRMRFLCRPELVIVDLVPVEG